MRHSRPDKLPLLPTMGVGSWATPSWVHAAREHVRKGSFGSQDIRETFDDAVRIAVGDQLEAGLDIITDGEMRHHRFVFGFYQHLEGLERVEPPRLMGVPGYDSAPTYRRVGNIQAPNGLGLVEDFRLLSHLVPDRPVKVAMPGPITMAAFISTEHDQDTTLREVSDVVRREIDALIDAGATWIQIDEPAVTSDVWSTRVGDAVDVINSVVTSADAYVGLHVCFGNNVGRPMSERSLSRLFPELLGVKCDQFVLEFANREMAEADLWSRLGDRRDIAVGVIDVKSFYVETPALVASRLRAVLRGNDPERVLATTDCGFSATPRVLARAKARALVEGTQLIRAELG